MQEGILNEPTRENAQRLMESFSHQMGLHFTNLLFVTVASDGTFRTANYSSEGSLTKEAVKLIAKHMEEWADSFGE